MAEQRVDQNGEGRNYGGPVSSARAARYVMGNLLVGQRAYQLEQAARDAVKTMGHLRGHLVLLMIEAESILEEAEVVLSPEADTLLDNISDVCRCLSVVAEDLHKAIPASEERG